MTLNFRCTTFFLTSFKLEHSFQILSRFNPWSSKCHLLVRLHILYVSIAKELEMIEVGGGVIRCICNLNCYLILTNIHTYFM